MAANSNQGLVTAVRTIHQGAGMTGFWRGLIPWAWIEASTKGAVLLFTASEIEWATQYYAGASKSMAGILGGMGGGVAQVTRTRSVGVQKSSLQYAAEIFKKEGIVGLNKGVNAVGEALDLTAALRQMTNWGSRLGISRIVESSLMNIRDPNDRKRPLSTAERLSASVVGGALACWNQPIEVIRVKMQSLVSDPTRPAKMTIATCARWIYAQNGVLGFYRGVTPRIGLSVYLTVCMVFGGDSIKAYFK
ncbi:Mitochondrial DNA replication protein yhm2 [Kappamyces sp. JEL0829]|nr:Mitochondrial DNA replication protein yhm2 [Kappamyces sp. JEL0829]